MWVYRYVRALCRLSGPFALAIACYILLYRALPDASLFSVPVARAGNSTTVIATGVQTYTVVMPLMPKHCFYESPRPRLVGSALLPGQVTFRNPPHCTTGWPSGTMIPANGDYSNIEIYTLCILAYGADSLYYPQSPNACVGAPPNQESGAWNVPLYLGIPGGSPEWFDLVAIVADVTASQFISNWLENGCEDEYTGIPAIMFASYNITEKAAISVQTID